jgi:phosphoribosylanthranilate isomerase
MLRIIKICGVRAPEQASLAIASGATMIGIIAEPHSPRHVNLELAGDIARVTKAAGGTPVAVFVNQSERDMRLFCEKTEIQVVQLHGVTAREQHHHLPSHFTRIYVLDVCDQGTIQPDKTLGRLNPMRDFILIDQPKNNPSYKNPIKKLHYDLPFPWIIAGNLQSRNVCAIVKRFKPQGVDVSSGVESSIGNKDPLLIQQFIQALKE